eukprot:9954452-Lingulodinium_polyedra.AAC.1
MLLLRLVPPRGLGPSGRRLLRPRIAPTPARRHSSRTLARTRSGTARAARNAAPQTALARA